MSGSTMKDLAGELLNAVAERDVLFFSRAHFKLTNLCRQLIFQGDKAALERCYPVLSDLLVRFYKFGKPEWPEVDRMMGGVEALVMLIANFLQTRTLSETIAEVRNNPADTLILKHLFEQDGARSGELASRAGMKPNALTNRLHRLEGKGLIVRTRLGKNSIVYLTPKGSGIAESLCKPVCLVPDASGGAVAVGKSWPDFSGIEQPPDADFKPWPHSESPSHGAAVN